MPSSELYSHPGKLLETHLINVAAIAAGNMAEKSISLADNALLKDVVYITALCHDLGKATAYFQEYLFGAVSTRSREKGGEETKHGLLSAVACYFVVSEFIAEHAKGDDGRALLPFLAFLAVKRHHGDLGDIIDEAVVTDEKLNVLRKQVDRIDDVKFAILIDSLAEAGLPVRITKNMLKRWISEINGEMGRIRRLQLRKLEKREDMNPYIISNMIFSLLIDADKTEVTVGAGYARHWCEISPEIVDEYKASLAFKDTKINAMRERAYKEAMAQPIDLEQRVFSINLPTGLGKTFISLAFALKLRKALFNDRNIKPRIIYALPFLSIIEQNADQFEKILRHAGISTNTDILLKHHHLSEIYYKSDEQEYETDDAKILIEGWNSEIIITTFIQLFHTMVSNRNKMLKKFHRLANSIILLDEIQSIPPKYWLLLNELLHYITEELNSYVVMITATEPLIFDKEDVFYLVDRNNYFSSLDRVTVKVKLNDSMTLNEFVDSLCFEADKSYLFIMNTISAAKRLYDLLAECLPGACIEFLSSRIVPCQRLRCIDKMRRKESRIAVTTQLVEAGVDIDFDVVYRDLAPFDSLNQAAGRCNRNGLGKGIVVIVSLKDDKRNYASYIYDDILLEATRELLFARKEIHEYDFLRLIEEYYRLVVQRMAGDRSEKLCSAIYGLKYESKDQILGISDFKLIEDDYLKLEVFIETTQEARMVWQRYCELKDIANIIERRKKFDGIKKDFYVNVISIPQNSKNMPPMIHGFGYVSANVLDDYYDEKTGYKSEEETEIW